MNHNIYDSHVNDAPGFAYNGAARARAMGGPDNVISWIPVITVPGRREPKLMGAKRELIKGRRRDTRRIIVGANWDPQKWIPKSVKQSAAYRSARTERAQAAVRPRAPRPTQAQKYRTRAEIASARCGLAIRLAMKPNVGAAAQRKLERKRDSYARTAAAYTILASITEQAERQVSL